MAVASDLLAVLGVGDNVVGLSVAVFRQGS